MRMAFEMDLHRFQVDCFVDFVDIVDNFAVRDRSVVVAICHDQTLDLAERLVNYSMVDLLAVDDSDCQIFDSDRFHGRTNSKDYYYMSLDYSCCRGRSDSLLSCLALDSNWHLQHKQKKRQGEKEREMRTIVIQ